MRSSSDDSVSTRIASRDTRPRRGCLAVLAFLVMTVLTVGALYAATVTLVWNANTESDLAGYKIYQSTVSGQYGAPVAVVGNVTTQTLTLPSLDVDQAYFFAITAYDLAGNESGKSAEVNRLIAGVPVALPFTAPTNLVYANGKFSWNAVPGATGYLLRVHDVSTPYATVCDHIAWAYCNARGTLTSTSVTVPLKPGTYDYWVQAHNATTEGPPSGGVITITAPPVDVPPAPPTGLQITVNSASQIVIVASAKECTRVLTSTKGTTAAQQVRTITCVK